MKPDKCTDCGKRFTVNTPFMSDHTRIFLPGVEGAVCRECANRRKEAKKAL